MAMQLSACGIRNRHTGRFSILREPELKSKCAIISWLLFL
jgi:hypothetical protein